MLLRHLRGEFSFVRGNVLLLMIVWAVTDFANFLPDTYYSLYVESLGASAFLIGMVLAAGGFAMAFLQLMGGYWAERYGRKLLIMSMSFGRGFVFLVFAAAPSWHFILLGEVLIGVSVVSQPAMMAMVADSLPADKRGLGYSLSLVVGATSILSPVVAGFLYLQHNLVVGMRIAYLIVAGCWFVSGFVLLRLTETLKSDVSLSLKEALRQYPRAVRECVAVWKVVPKPMLNLLVVFTPISFFVRMCIPFYVLYATDVLGVSGFQWALLFAWQSIVYFVMLVPVGKFVDVFGRKTPLILSSGFVVFGTVLFLYGDVSRLYVFFAFSALSNATVFTAYSSLQADLTPRESRGKVLGFSNFVDGLLASVALLLGGYLYESVAPSMPFVLLLVTAIVTVVATFFFIEEPKTKQE